MTVSEFMTCLNLPAPTVYALQSIPLPENHAALKESFFLKTSLFEEFAEADPAGLTVLKLYLNWAADTKARYDRLGIPEEYFFNSMKDIPIWCDDYLSKHGTPGFQEWGWVGCSLRLEIIRIGRLQYGLSQLSREVSCLGKSFPAGTPFLDVHIPAGEPLSPEAALASLNQAPGFYSKFFGRQFSLFHCHSWLLAPQLKELLPENSRILQFQDLFCVYDTDTEEPQAEERIFGFHSEDPRNYPEETSLQKAAKQYLLSGKQLPMGAGIRTIG